jgi:hypothetical protein
MQQTYQGYDPNNNQEHAAYQRAIKALDKAGKVAQHHKLAEHPTEIDFMKRVNVNASTSLHTMHYQPGQYENIFFR